MLNNPSTTIEDKVTIPPDVFVPALIEHLYSRETADRTVRAIASLLALESIAGKKDYTHAIVLHGGKRAIESIMELLERTGNDRRTLFIQEQAARAMFYLTEGKILASLQRKHEQLTAKGEEFGGVESIDLPRALRNMLDHCSVSKNPNLQRWSTSTIHHLVLEDQRRATMAVNEVAAAVASGQAPDDLEYNSFLDQLVSTGGIMILCSLIGAEDADTRAHAVAACQAILSSTRIMDNSRAALAEMTGGQPGGSETKDGEIVRALIAGGGCGSSVSQLLISADNAVAGMGCDFVASLVGPLLSQAAATASLPSQYDWRSDNDGMGACREAALEIATGACLPALLSLVRQHVRRPVELKKSAMETLAAVVLAVGEIGRAWAGGKYEEGLEMVGAPAKLKEALLLLNEEGTIDAALELLQSTAAQSLGSAADTPASRMRECAGIILASLTTCSAEAIMELQTRKVVSPLLLASNDASMLSPSSIRGDTAPRCLGVLETVASVLMFAWQHPSGASNELLDQLIEALDVGAISFLSKVLLKGVEWDSKDKAVGGMKSATACFRLLCCLFGIALTDETTIGMKRLMDAVDADSYNYNTGRNKKGPHNIVEAVLGSLQVASATAKKALMGSLGQGAHYQTALMDMLEAAVLATGSMCGSSVAPGGGEGTLIKGENFLALRSDEYVSRRRDICSAACDVVVRSGRAGPPLLPTMLVGGFGEGTVVASLRLSLAIAQNGVKTQHAKLAHSGILVPISDILRSALSNGDLYKFSAALALVRNCGPHVASGESGGLQSVRDAIRIATNVMTLPIPHDASIEQIETQESLKAECISALESLSHNAALWNAISTDALPSMVRYLQSTGDSPGASARMRETRCAALRVFLQLVQVPSHAVSAAESGLAQPLGKVLRNRAAKNSQEEDDEVPMLALEVLQVITKNDNARRKARILDTGVARDICNAIGNAATEKPKKPTDSRANITVIGLDILQAVLRDVESDVSTQSVLQSPAAIAFLDAVASERNFVRAMCSTLLLKTGMKLPVEDEETGQDHYEIPKLYGPPLVLVREACGGYANTHEAVAAIFFSVAVYACAIDSKRSDAFWKTSLLKDAQPESDPEESAQTAATFSAHLLSLLDSDYKPFMPLDPQRMEDFNLISRPLVRHHLLEALRDSIAAGVSGDGSDPYFVALFVKFNVPRVLLTLWDDPALLDVAFGLLKQVVEIDPDDVLHLFVESKEAIQALFNMLNLDPPAGTATDISEIRRFLASILGKLAENGLLTDAVTKFDARSAAIGALAAACLTEEAAVVNDDDDDEDMTSNRLSSGLMRCLVELCTVRDAKGGNKIVLSAPEAEAIAKNLGKKICHMVLSRFLERAKLQEYEMEEEEEIMNAPDVAMLCAVAQHDAALQILRRIGGLHALSQIASEGELSAVLVLKKACQDDFSLLLEADTFKSIMCLFSKKDHVAHWRTDVSLRRQIEGAAFDLLASLCGVSQKGRKAVGAAEECEQCTARAIEIVGSLGDDADAEDAAPPTVAAESDDDDDAPPSYNAVEVPADKIEMTADDSALCASAMSFLSSLVSVPAIRKELVENDDFIKASSSLVKTEISLSLRYDSIKLIKSLAPFATKDSTLNADLVADVLIEALNADVKSSGAVTAGEVNGNLIHGAAVGGLQITFSTLESDKQLDVARSVVNRFTKSVKTLTVAKGDKRHLGQLIYNMTLILLLARGKDSSEEAFTKQLMSSLINVVQWRYDPKTKLEDPDGKLLCASVTHCLQVLSLTLMTTDEQVASLGIKKSDLSGTVLMVARPGKAPRKAIDMMSALSKAIDGADAACGIAAANLKNLIAS
ncbi:expressed unknown protein [Seminavis robusta]|uniref:Uncharacterized protein n=1 Tax=Seminavis robusta TaxID=568900 RepID=A0A9N8EZL2_9STRA|nr:expressed unknown protein [Seminavis robusta]|eukprot:Sro2108_g314920.1 n/a (1832) ;mRNA; r:12395-18133